jgi:hypothetical protein
VDLRVAAVLPDIVLTPPASRKLVSPAPLAQWQSSGLLIHWLAVRARRGAPDFDLRTVVEWLHFASKLTRFRRWGSNRGSNAARA